MVPDAPHPRGAAPHTRLRAGEPAGPGMGRAHKALRARLSFLLLLPAHASKRDPRDTKDRAPQPPRLPAPAISRSMPGQLGADRRRKADRGHAPRHGDKTGRRGHRGSEGSRHRLRGYSPDPRPEARLRRPGPHERHDPLLEAGTFERRPQEGASSYYGGRKPEDGLIDWAKSAMAIYNLVRAVTHPYPGAYTFFGGRKLFIWKAVPQEGTAEGAPGHRGLDKPPSHQDRRGTASGHLASAGRRG